MTLDEAFRATLTLFHDTCVDYLVLGGWAVSVVGEARATLDIDALIFIEEEGLSRLLDLSKTRGFAYDDQQWERWRLRGVAQLTYGEFRLDLISGSMPFEREALRRKQVIPLYGIPVAFPTPEDLILFKLIPGREKDRFDAQGLVARHHPHLDLPYLRHWAAVIAEDLQDPTIHQRLDQLLAPEP